MESNVKGKRIPVNVRRRTWIKGKKVPNDICVHALSVFVFCGWTAPLVPGQTFIFVEKESLTLFVVCSVIV